jgi:hypothetical protein
MATEESNNNAPKTFSEIMEQLKAALDKAAKAVVAGTPIDPLTLQETTDLIHCAKSCFAPFRTRHRQNYYRGRRKGIVPFFDPIFRHRKANFYPPYHKIQWYRGHFSG